MAININIVKKYSAYLIMSVLPISVFMLLLVPQGLTNALLITGVTVIVCIFVANWLLYNSFRGMLEGQGLLTIMLDSKGVIGLTVLGISNGRIVGKIENKQVSAIYESNLIHTLPAPQIEKNGYTIQKENDKEYLVVSMEHLRQFKYGFEQYPVLIYNTISGQLITKDFLGDREKKLMEHLVFNANETAKSLTRSMLNFSRAVVEAEGEKDGINWGKWIMIVIIVGVVAFMGYMLYQAFVTGGGGDAVISGINSAGSVITDVNK